MSKTRLTLALTILLVGSIGWAVPVTGTAHQRVRQSPPAGRVTVPRPIKFREDRDRGLLVDAWINGSGPYVFAIDTGAGTSIVSPSLISRSALQVRNAYQTLEGGLTGSSIVSDQEATIQELALGSPDNLLPGRLVAAVAPGLPSGLDGVLDPTEAFSPLGYSIDLPGHEMQAFNSKARLLHIGDVPEGGAMVRWIRERGGSRPFVLLGDGRLALLDTGSGFGLAVSDESSIGGLNHGRQTRNVSDLGGGRVQSRGVAPVTVSIGALVLRSVPTDVLTGVPPGTPVILGRGALYPFRITFDPTAKLIAIEPSQN
jgi:hypothetical protein